MVAPPDGTARIALVVPKADSEEYALIGKTRQLVFLTENVEAKYREWKERGVKFDCPPEIAPFGSVVANFEDVDGNRFAMIEFDQASPLVQEQRRQSEERLESERRRAQEMEIARQVPARLSRKRRQRRARWNTPGLVYGRGTWEETTTISLSSAKDGSDSWSAISPVKESRPPC
jgi:hypothetical protein